MNTSSGTSQSSGGKSDAKPVALVVGAGKGLSASLARMLAPHYHVVLAARDTSDLADLVRETNALAVDCDAGEQTDMEKLFERIDELPGALSVAIYNPSARSRGSIAELDPADVERALRITAYGAFLMAHLASKRMLPQASGTLLFTGASAGVKGFANSAPFAMGKFALRGLCQSLARELHPKGIHVGHIIIDGVIASAAQKQDKMTGSDADSKLSADAIAESYHQLIEQHRSAWTWEVELRPWTETF